MVTGPYRHQQLPTPDWSKQSDVSSEQPSAARVYDFLLGGGSHFAVDRQAGQAILDAAPGSARAACANRAFLGRLVSHVVDSGIDQILDLGSGLPTVGNVHNVAHQVNPATQVVYVDWDPVAVAHARHLLAGDRRVGVVEADLRTPLAVHDDPITREHLDFTRPMAILMISVLHFVDGDLTELVNGYRRAMAPGSMLGISHATPPGHGAEQHIAAHRVAEVYQRTATPIHLRDSAAISHLFDGLELLAPGLVPVDRWRPADGTQSTGVADAATILGALGRTPTVRSPQRRSSARQNSGPHMTGAQPRGCSGPPDWGRAGAAAPAGALTTGQRQHSGRIPVLAQNTVNGSCPEPSLFPKALHICGYDVRGTFVDTGEVRRPRETGLVAHTHHLLDGLARQHPGTQVAITVTGAVEPQRARCLRTPEGHTAELRTIATAFPDYLRTAGNEGKDETLVRHFYEDTIDDPDNPIWRSLAEQYAQGIHEAAIPDLLLQNTNPLVSVLKAEEFGLINHARLGELRLTGVIHDATDLNHRFGYIARRLEHTQLRVRLVAVSDAMRRALIEHGVAPDLVCTVRNGLDVRGFEQRLERARTTGAFDRVRERNRLPVGRRVLVSARRVPWKGHEDVVAAAGLMEQRGGLGDFHFVFNGAGMLDTRWADYESRLVRQIHALGLSNRVFLLDELAPDEVASCYLDAAVAVSASREPEPFGYSNIEAMLAGIPTIATRHGGPLEYIEDGLSGLLVRPMDPGAIADAIHLLLSDEDLRLRIARAGQTSARRFTLRAMFDGYAAVIAS